MFKNNMILCYKPRDQNILVVAIHNSSREIENLLLYTIFNNTTISHSTLTKKSNFLLNFDFNIPAAL